MKRSRRKEKPLLYVLLIAALALNTTMSFVVLANRNRVMSQPRIAEPQAETAAQIKPENTEPPRVDKKTGVTSEILSRPEQVTNRKPAKKAEPPKAEGRGSSPSKVENVAREEMEVVFLPSPILYRVARDTTLVTRRDGTRVLIPKGTKVHVTGFTRDDKALVVSRRGNPDGFIPKASIEEVREERERTVLPLTPPKATGNPGSRYGGNFPGSLPTPRISGGPHGGSIGFGPAYIYVSRNGQISGSFSR